MSNCNELIDDDDDWNEPYIDTFDYAASTIIAKWPTIHNGMPFMTTIYEHPSGELKCVVSANDVQPITLPKDLYP